MILPIKKRKISRFYAWPMFFGIGSDQGLENCGDALVHFRFRTFMHQWFRSAGAHAPKGVVIIFSMHRVHAPRRWCTDFQGSENNTRRGFPRELGARFSLLLYCDSHYILFENHFVSTKSNMLNSNIKFKFTRKIYLALKNSFFYRPKPYF